MRRVPRRNASFDEGLTLFARTRRVPLAWLNGADMSEEKITLEVLAHQIRGLRDEVLSLKDDMAVLTAMVARPRSGIQPV